MGRPSALLAPLVLTVGLAACAPLSEQVRAYTRSQTYPGTCAVALARLDAVAIRTQPSAALSGHSWSPLQRQDAGPYTSTLLGTDLTVTVTATCTEANGQATLTVASRGQPPASLDTLNTALLDGVALQR